MRSIKYTFLSALSTVTFLCVFVTNTYASTLTLTSNETQLNVGDTVSVQIILNTEGEDINAVAANLSYPGDKLEVVSIDSTPLLPMVVEQTAMNNLINTAQGS